MTGTPVQAVALLLVCSFLYDRFVAPYTTTRLNPTLETWWWAVYVASAPLLFGGPFVHPMVGLFCTRFVVELLSVTCRHWALLLGSQNTRLQYTHTPHQRLGLPLLPD